MNDDFMSAIVLDKNKKKIGIEKFDDTKTMIETNDELPDNIIVTLITCVTKDGNKFYPQLCLEEALVA